MSRSVAAVLHPLLAAESRPVVDTQWIADNWDLVLDAGLEHVVLTLTSLLAGLAISLILVAAVQRWPSLREPVIAVGGVLYSIPSLAAFAFLVPLFGIGMTASVVALATYTVLILVRNMLTGLDGVDPAVIEAARGQGLTDHQVLWRVQVPLALPTVFAGLRVATVTVIGLVTVTALIGQGGLGQLILTGFRLLPPLPVMIVVGTVGSIILAVAFDLALVALQRALTPWTHVGDA